MAKFYNQATLSYNGTVTNSNITAGEIVEVLSADKYAVTDTYTADSDIVYIISIVNSGSSPVGNITVTDDLGAYPFGENDGEAVPLDYNERSVGYYINGIQQLPPAVSSTSPLTINGITVPAGGNALIVYSARTNAFAPLGAGAAITNTASISGTGFETITVSESISADNGIDLAITKALSPSSVEANGEVVYTFVIQNFGGNEVTASDDVIFSDTFSPALGGLTAEFNDVQWRAGTNYSYSEDTGSFSSLSGQITVPAAEFVQDETTGEWSVQPGISTLTIKGNIL